MEEYSARSPIALFQIVSPLFLLSATRVADLPPGVHSTLSPSMSGDSL